MKTFLSFFVILIFIFPNAQEAPEIEWAKCFGGLNNDEPAFTLQTSDGNYFIVGYTYSNDGDVSYNHSEDSDVWAIKLDHDGNLLWQKSYGGTDGDSGYSAHETNDGGFIISATTSSNDGDASCNDGDYYFYGNYWILKLDSAGEIEWSKCYGGSHTDIARQVIQTNEGGYIIAGSSKSIDGDVTGHHNPGGATDDYWIVKTDSGGDLEWEKSYGGDSNDVAISIQQTFEGGFIVSGYSYSSNGDVTNHHGSNGNPDYWVIKLNSLGELEWEKSLGGSLSDYSASILQTIDGGYLVAGSSNSHDGDVNNYYGYYDYWIVKLNEGGNIEWEKNYGGSDNEGSYAETSTTISIASDNTYLIAGASESQDGDVTGNHAEPGTHNYDLWILKINQQGDILWEKSLGGSDDEGYQEWSVNRNSALSLLDGGYLITGSTFSYDFDVTENHGEMDFWVVKLGPDQMSTFETNSTQISIYPNPVNDILHFSEKLENIQIYNLSGQMIFEMTNKSSIKVSHLNSGTYILKAKNQKGENIQLKFLKN